MAHGDGQQLLLPSLLLALLLLSTGCSSAGQAYTGRSDLPPLCPSVVLFEPWQKIDSTDSTSIGRNLGSAVMIDQNLLLTAAHLIADVDGVIVDGVALDFEVVFDASEDGRDRFEGDWAILRIGAAPSRPTVALADYPESSAVPRDGFQIAGYTEVGSEVACVEGACRVVDPPRAFARESDNLLFYKGPTGGGGLPGMSGGPAAVWNNARGRYELIGIHVQTLRVSLLGIHMPKQDIGVVRLFTSEDLATALRNAEQPAQ